MLRPCNTLTCHAVDEVLQLKLEGLFETLREGVVQPPDAPSSHTVLDGSCFSRILHRHHAVRPEHLNKTTLM